MSATDRAPLSQSALLVVDVQDSFTLGPRWATRGTPGFETNLSRLLDAYRTAGLPVVFILHTDGDDGFQPWSPHFRPMDFLRRREGEPLLVKTTRNAFTSTNLRERLEALGVRRLVVTGITTEQCCETTTRFANDVYGYDVDFVTEATLTFPILDDDGDIVLSTEEIARRTEHVLRGRFAAIATVDEVLRELEASGVAASAGG